MRVDYNLSWDDLFYYDETSPSCLRWKINYGWTGRYFINKIGSIAGNPNNKNDYFKVNIDKKKYYIHRIVWLISGFSLLGGQQINHIDCDRQNNKISNLEACSQADNTRRRKEHLFFPSRVKDTESGINGVVFRRGDKNSRWVAHWSENGRLNTCSFSCNKFGHGKAKEMAIIKRQQEIERLKNLGYGYK